LGIDGAALFYVEDEFEVFFEPEKPAIGNLWLAVLIPDRSTLHSDSHLDVECLSCGILKLVNEESIIRLAHSIVSFLVGH
jgi:hypothetical protein